MSTNALLDFNAIQAALRAGAEAEQSLDAQLSESLAALTAYQSHLDGWQAQLARERDELRHEREQWEHHRPAVENSSGQLSSDATTELNSLRDNCTILETKRSELACQLEEARARELQLKSDLEAQQRTLDEERDQWAHVSQQLREELEQRPSAAVVPGDALQVPSSSESRAKGASHRETSGTSAVLGSIVEQFGKLRQQRAIDRQGLKKAR